MGLKGLQDQSAHKASRERWGLQEQWDLKDRQVMLGQPDRQGLLEQPGQPDLKG